MPPRRRRVIEDSSALRAFLLDQERKLYGAVCAELDKLADALAAGCEVNMRRHELPNDHPMRYAGESSDLLVLGADDELRPA